MLKSSYFRSIAVAIFLCLTQIAFAQTKVTVDGTVKDSKGNPVAAAFILEKGTMNGTSADLDGKFSLTVPANAVVSVECIGFTTVEFKAAKSETKNIVLEDDALALDDAVVVGYSTTSKRDLISSVSHVKTQEIGNLPATNITQGLAGRSPGLIVVQSNGGLNKNPSISIRGGGTPLYVIDGVIRDEIDFQTIAPEDIEQMNVLKDASATAIYGSRAANGIIQVVTKKGAKGRVAVDYDFNQSFKQPGNWLNNLDIAERYEYANQGSANDGLAAQYGDQIISNAKQHLDGQGRSMQKPREYCLRDWAPQTKHTLRVQGGSDIAQTYASYSNIHEETIFKNTETYYMNRSNIRLAETVNLKKAGLQFNVSFDGYMQDYTRSATTAEGYGDWALFSHFQNSAEQCYLNKYGLPLDIGGSNTLIETSSENGYDRTNTYVGDAKGEVVWNLPWVKGLKIRAATNYRFHFADRKEWVKAAPVYEWDSTVPIYKAKPYLTQTNSKKVDYTNQIFAEYGNTFGKHSFNVLAGYEENYFNGYTYSLWRKNYEFHIDQIEIGPADQQYNSGSEYEQGRKAFIAQARYNYDGRYYVEGSFRYDGSDYFAEGKRWGPFFGGSLGWVLTGENWMKNVVNRNIFNLLKVRASFGQTGLDSSAGRFAYLQTYSMSAQGNVVGGAFVPTFSEGDLPSPDLTWYTTTQTDVGLDFASLNSRLYGSFDWFYYTTKGYLVAPTGVSYLNQIIGISMPKVKSDSEYRREGIEVQLGWRDQAGDFFYDISGNVTYFDQMWAYDQSESESSYMNPYTRSQQATGYYSHLLHNLGYYKDQDDVFNSVAQVGAINTGYLRPGDIKYEDTNGDGLIDGNDNRKLGKSSTPRCQFGLNFKFGYKGFYLNALFQGSSAANKYMSGTMSMKTDQVGNLTTIYPFHKDTWTPTNTSAAFPRLMSNTNINSNNNYASSDFWLVNCAYLRFKDFQFGYDFKYALMKNVNFISTLKLGISGSNIFTLSEASKFAMDPEQDADGYCYPVERTLAITLNIGFK